MSNDMRKIHHWSPPQKWQRIECIDLHVGGEPLRFIVSGMPEVIGATMYDRMLDARRNHDIFRRQILQEPRGHADMYGCWITEPVEPDADFGVIFLDNDDYTPMCGHGTIALTTILATTGMIKPSGDEASVRYDTPAGRVQAVARIKQEQVERITFENVPSYLLYADYWLDIPETNLKICCDVAYGGEWYVYLDVSQVNLTIRQSYIPDFVKLGRQIKHAAQQQFPQIPFYGTVFTQPTLDPKVHSKQLLIFGDGSVDRSPSGTTVSGRLAVLHAKEHLSTQQPIIFESIIGSQFIGTIAHEVQIDNRPAIVPQVTGSAHITGRHEFYLNPNDPLGNGFYLR